MKLLKKKYSNSVLQFIKVTLAFSPKSRMVERFTFLKENFGIVAARLSTPTSDKRLRVF